jgi:uncharacterized membrane protein YjgN (DUF898 family)
MSATPSPTISGQTLDAAPSAAASTRVEPFQFTGTGGEYFRIWIVNLLLTVLTLGIYSAWAKVRRMRYFYGNTRLAGSAFEYHGQPLQILKGRLIAVGALVFFAFLTTIWPLTNLLFVIVILLGTPWIIVKARLFHMRMSSYRNIRFNFRQDYGEAARIFIGLALLITLTLGLIYPYWTFRRYQFAITNTSFGTTPFGFTARPGEYYRIYFISLLFWIPVLWGFYLLLSSFPGVDESGAAIPPDTGRLAALVPVLLLSIVVPYFVAMTYLQKSLGNVSYGSTLVGPHRLRSTLEMWPLLRIYVVNTLLIVLTLGLFLPWAQVRLARYRLESLSLEVHGGLDAFVADQQSQVAAAGEELGEVFDVDLGL